ncbi:MAG TPA: SDR family NAD(P)-dependent oxidoreductase, partial [Microlunatus sp.]|nr:SDR family NAD(P)-dependent oxidoreductase [Microlunatus sp.]
MVQRRSGSPERVAVVTGAARGIGAAIAHRLAGQGMAVAAVDLDTDGSARTANGIVEAGGRAITVGADVGEEAAARHAIERAAAELGPVTVLVNNAGIIRDNLLFKMTTDDWDAVMNVHLRGAFLMSRAAQAHMIDAKWGRIVNLSSTSALGNRGQVNYSAAKAGLQGFTKTLALELGK